MFVIALTGGIGTGKSTVANLFQGYGVPIIDSDIIARELTEKNGRLYEKVASHFGKSILLDDGSIDRKKLRETIFDDPKERQWLETTLHPEILADIQDLLSQVDSPYCMVVIPLLAQVDDLPFIDHVLAVDAPVTIQKSRLEKRDQNSPELIDKIIAAQAKREDVMAIANDIIRNDGNLPLLEEQVSELHMKYNKVENKCC